MASISASKKAQGVKYQVKSLLGTEDIFQPANGNKNLHETSNDNGVRIVIFAKFSMNFDLFRTCGKHHAVLVTSK
jgi:hypothetical protein